MDKEIFEMYAGTIFLTEIVCIIILVQSYKYLEKVEKLGFWRFMGAIMIGVHAGFGFVKIYLQIWPTSFELSIHWLTVEVFTLITAGFVAFMGSYALLVLLLGIKRHPKS